MSVHSVMLISIALGFITSLTPVNITKNIIISGPGLLYLLSYFTLADLLNNIITLLLTLDYTCIYTGYGYECDFLLSKFCNLCVR